MSSSKGKPGTSGKGVAEALAISILGEKRFLSADRVVAAWNKLITEHRTDHSVSPLNLSESISIRYTEETLNALADDSAWYLIYDPGISLKDNLAILGTDPKKQPCHREDNNWWLAEREQDWVNINYDAGYYLVRMEGVLPLDDASKDWRWQDKQVQQMGEAFQRAPSQIVLNACVSCYLLNNQQFLTRYNNFGPERDADYCYVTISYNPEEGFSLGHWVDNDWGGYWGSEIRVLLSRKFDV